MVSNNIELFKLQFLMTVKVVFKGGSYFKCFVRNHDSRLPYLPLPPSFDWIALDLEFLTN